MTNREYLRSLVTLAIPVALQNLLATCANIVDTAMVAGLGNAQVAAVGVAGRWVFFLNVIFWGLATGTGAQLSQYWGAGEKDNMRRTQCTATLSCVGLASVFALSALIFPRQLIMLFNREPEVVAAGAEYIRIIAVGLVFSAVAFACSTAYRATENVKLPMYISALSVITNTVLNYILIFGNFGAPELGVKGAAIATCVSLVMQGVIFIIIGVVKKHFSVLSISAVRDTSTAFVKKYMGISLPAALNEALWGGGVVICAAIFARQGSENYAAYTIYTSLENIAFIFFQGLAAATSVMVGKHVGNGKLKTAYAIGKRTMIITPIMGFVTGLLLIVLRDPLLMLFDIETEAARQTVRTLLLIYGLWFGIRMINYSSVVGIFRAGGDSRYGVFVDLLGQYVSSVPSVLFVTYVLKVPFVVSVATMLIMDDIVKAPLNIHHFRSRKWIKKLTLSGCNSEEEQEC